MILLVFFCSYVTSVWSQDPLLVRWNNSVFVDHSTVHHELIYLDEIVMRTSGVLTSADGPGILICRVSTPDSSAGWRRPDDTAIVTENYSSDFTQYNISRYGANIRVQLARARDPLQDGASNNGLWTCNGGGNPPRHVPLYNRGNGEINVVALSLHASSFGSNTFTLAADTTGGPPTTFSWIRNGGHVLTNSSSYTILIPVANPNNNREGRENCLYRSILQVTGILPGTYQYNASNRATNGNVTGSFTIEGGDPSNLRVVQTGINMVELTWDPPPGPPSRGYQVQYRTNIISTTSTSLVIDMLAPGEYSFQVTSLSQHFRNGIVGPETMTVQGTFTPNITLSELTATSVRVSWPSPPMFSITVQRYSVAIVRLTVCDSVLFIRGPRPQSPSDTTELFEELGEYIDYRAEVNIHFQLPSSSFTVSAEMEFFTLAISPSEIPSNVILITTSRTISVSWDAIDCGNQNGPNFRYEVEFLQMDGRAVPVGTVNNVMFTVEGLQPFTNYTFQVRGVNDAGNGSYTDLIAIQTDQDTPGEVAGLVSRQSSFTSALITWSPPQVPNGIIITYELTYLLNETMSISENITSPSSYAIESVVNTRIEVRVRAYTIVGPGPIVMTSITLPSPIVTNIQVESLTATSAVVSWDRIPDIPDITEYKVYYAPVLSCSKKELSMTVHSTEISVEVSGLESTVEYQYQVTAVAMFDAKRQEGDRSPVTGTTTLRIKEPGERIDCSTTTAVSVVVSVLLTIILNNAVLMVGYYIVRAHRSKHSKIFTADTGDMAMKENAAYGPVTSGHDYEPSQPDVKTESDYDVVK